MRVQLSRYFQPLDTPIKTLKQIIKSKKKPKHKQIPIFSHQSLEQIQIIDPLKSQISFFKKSETKSKSNDVSEGKAFKNLKDYIVQQERYLNQIKLQKRKTSKDNDRRVKTEIEEPSVSQSQIMAEIPEVADYFRNQKRDSLLYRNRQLRREISDKISYLEGSIREYSPVKSESVQLVPAVGDLDFDRKLQKDKQRNKRLIQKLEKQKWRIKQLFSSDKKEPSDNYLDQPLLKLDQPRTLVKKRVTLKGLKSVSLKINSQSRKLSPSIALMFQLRNFSSLKQKKQFQLQSMLKHQFYNRPNTLKQKDHHYTQQMSNKAMMTPAAIFKSRKMMDDKLTHRLKATKDQADNFRELLKGLKEDRVMVCEALQGVFDDLRVMVLSGKILKEKDLEEILEKYKECEELREPGNVAILKKVRGIMV